MVPTAAESEYPLIEGFENRFDRGERDASLPPRGRAGRDPCLVEPTGGVLDEANASSAVEQSPDRCVIADVRGDTEENHLVRIEAREQVLGIRIGEDVEMLLQEQELAAAQPAIRQRLEPDRNRIVLLGLGNLARAARAAEAMRWIG